MTTTKRTGSAAAMAIVAGIAVPVSAQTIETVGNRALGMGGAFVAVADDSSATWWNPGGLAQGPVLDMTLGRALTETGENVPLGRTRTGTFSLGTPPFGFSYYRLRITEALSPPSKAPPVEGREEGEAGVPVRSLSASQLGATVLQTLLPGVHVGTTLKYVRGTLLVETADSGLSASELLDRGDELGGGRTEGEFDLDVGVLAVGGPLRVGALVRNVLEPSFRTPGPPEDVFKLPRQVRLGVAVQARGPESPLTLALDADVRTYATAAGERRVIAIGVEQWLLSRRLGIRGGTRFNTAGAEDRAATGGVSVAVRSALYLEGHVVGGSDAGDRGWGAAARVSF